MIYTSLVQEDEESGDLILELPPELIDEMKWDENTILDWTIEDNKVFIKENKDARGGESKYG